jgi:translocation and assembly module TamB
MPLGKGQRRVLRTTVFIGVSFVVTLLLLPLWFPWVLRPLASRNFVHYSSYRREGYARFVLENVSFTNKNVRVRAGQFEALTPGALLWRGMLHNDSSQQNALRVTDWNLTFLAAAPADQPTGAPGSTYTNIVSQFSLADHLNRWVPVAALTNGTIQAPGIIFKLPFATLTNGNLISKVQCPRRSLEATVTANLDASRIIRASVSSKLLNENLTVVAELDSSGLRFEGTNNWRDNLFRIKGHFNRAGALPETATLAAENLNVPASLLGLSGYENVTGSIHATWEASHFLMDVQAEAKPPASETNLPPANLRLHAHGDTTEAIIETAQISSPWLSVELSRKLHLSFTGPLLKEPGRLRFNADLNKQTILAAAGKLQGEVDFAPGSGKYPVADFQISGTDLESYSWKAMSLAVNGKLNWPWLDLAKAKAMLSDGSSAVAGGRFDLQEQLFEEVHANVSGQFVRRWLPSGMDYKSLSANAQLDGPVKAIRHRGTAQVSGFATAAFKPIDAQIEWKGETNAFRELSVNASTSSSELKLKGALELKPGGVSGSLREITLLTNSVSVMELSAPASFKFDYPGSNHWQTAMDSFRLSGKAGQVVFSGDINWPERGEIKLETKNLATGFVQDILKNPLEEIHLDNLSLAAAWTNGPVTFQVDGFVRQDAAGKAALPGAIRDFGPLALRLDLRGDPRGISISNLLLSSQTSRIISAAGVLPVTLTPGQQLIHFMREKPMSLSARTDPESVFWTKLSEQTGVALRKPNLRAEVTGSWSAPQGTVRLQADSIDIPKWRAKLPALEKLNAEMALNHESAWLTNCQMLVQGQPVKFSGELPLGETFWRDLELRKTPNLDKASGNVLIQKADLGAFASLFPTLLSPQGELSANLSLRPGANVEGELTIQNGRTRPLPNIGPLRDIELSLKFLQRTVQLASASVRVGGATVIARGQGDLRGTEWMKGIPPPFEFSLRGTNVPLSRQPSSIIRADLDLSVHKTARETPLISGQVRLRNSYFLSDLNDLVPGRTAATARRPPYFSIEDPGLADWRLAVRVTGERGIKVRTTLFAGEAAPNLRVQGTLKDPLAIGDVKIANGQIRLPFATLDVQQGFVTLTSEDPYRPRLQVNAASKRFGYDVRMEITGPVDLPVVQFTSTPPLSSEQLLLMMTAGELPKGTYSLSPQQRAQTVALFLGKDLLAKLGFGDQNSQRLTFNSGENISEAGRPTYDVDYKLTKRWSIEGEYDRFNAFNAGLKWKVYSK